MTRKQSILFGVSLFVFVCVSAIVFFRYVPVKNSFSILTHWKENISWQTAPKESGTFLVKRVVDGDTIELENGPASTRLGEAGEKVRYIGINTPESVDPRRGVECFGKEASEYNKGLVEGKQVRLERDITDRDKYGRLLRFVYLEDGTLINELLVREGYAVTSVYPPDVAHQDVFRRAEQEARNEKRGLWNESTCNGKK